MEKKQIHNHPQEEARLKALRSLQVLDTPIEERFERITRLVQGAFHVPICAISCIDRERVWFKSVRGIDASEVHRGDAFCQHTVLNHGPLIINDTRFDEQFAGLCTDPRFVFYAGMPMYSKDGFPIAVLCLIDSEPRFFDEHDLSMLKDFAKLAERELHSNTTNQIAYELIDHIDESWRQLLIDPVTRFWNHEGTMTLVGESISQACSGAQDSDAGMSLMMIDAPNLEIIRNHLGMDIYHQALKSFTNQLLKTVRESDTVGRIQDNEFLLTLPHVTDRNSLKAAMTRINTFLAQYQLDDHITKLISEHTDDWSLDASLASIRVLGGCTLNTSDCIELLDNAVDQTKRCPKGIPVILDTPIVPSDSSEDGHQRVA